MKKIRLGTKKRNINYYFRETCFGIVYKNNKFYLTEKEKEISLIGGGVEKNETHEETLKREFIEESGLTIKKITPFITIDCYWHTRDNKEMNSLANFYIVEVDNKINKPTESISKLVKINKDDILNNLELPYQKKAIELFLEEQK